MDGDLVAEAGAEDFGSKVAHEFGRCGEEATPPPTEACVPFQLRVRTDDWGEETRVVLTKGDTVVWDFADFDSLEVYNYDECLSPSVCHRLQVFDSEEDGMERPGRIIVWYDGIRVFSGRKFGDGLDLEYGSC